MKKIGRPSLAVIMAVAVAAAVIHAFGPPLYSQEAPAVPAVLKIGVVDITEVMRNYTRHKEAISSFSTTGAEVKHTLENMQAEIDKVKMAMADLRDRTDAWWKSKDKLDRLIKEKENYEARSDNQMENTFFSILQRSYDDITSAVETYGREQHFDLILWKKALASNGALAVVPYMGDGLDVTIQITERLNRAYDQQQNPKKTEK